MCTETLNRRLIATELRLQAVTSIYADMLIDQCSLLIDGCLCILQFQGQVGQYGFHASFASSCFCMPECNLHELIEQG